MRGVLSLCTPGTDRVRAASGGEVEMSIECFLIFQQEGPGLLTSPPLPSFLLSEGTHLKNENKVIVPVLFLKSLHMRQEKGLIVHLDGDKRR